MRAQSILINTFFFKYKYRLNILRKSALVIIVIITLFGGYYLMYTPYNAHLRSNVPIKYYQPDDQKSELLRALNQVGNHTLAYLPNSRSGLLMVVDLESGSILGSCKLGEFLNGPFSI